MKKIVLIFATIICFGLNCFGQNVVIQTNEVNKSKTNDDCAYRINGICTTEDLGGVEVSNGEYMGDMCHLIFENYNSFIVSVIFEITVTSYVHPNYVEEKQTGTIVLKPNEKKETHNSYCKPRDFKLIARKLKN